MNHGRWEIDQAKVETGSALEQRSRLNRSSLTFPAVLITLGILGG